MRLYEGAGAGIPVTDIFPQELFNRAMKKVIQRIAKDLRAEYAGNDPEDLDFEDTLEGIMDDLAMEFAEEAEGDPVDDVAVAITSSTWYRRIMHGDVESLKKAYTLYGYRVPAIFSKV